MSDAIDCGDVYPRNWNYYEGLEQYKDANTNEQLIDDPKLLELRPSEVSVQKEMKHGHDEEETLGTEDDEVLVTVLAADYHRSLFPYQP